MSNPSLDSLLSSHQKKSSTLKTLVILTVIGVCLFNFFGPVYSFFNINNNIDTLETKIQKLEEKEASGTVITTLQDALDASYKQRDNKNETLAINIFSGILCIVGAILMLKFNKNGFFIYTAGELLPILFHYIIIGFGVGKFALISSAFGIIIPLSFIVLYAIQLKEIEEKI
jgi:hypothetical protein